MTGTGANREGQVVGGKYRVLRFMAAGGMGEVYEAEHRALGRNFALKFLHPLLAKDRSSLSRFEREARVAGGIHSEHVVAPVDFGVAEDGTPYLAMEYLDGESVHDILARGTPVATGRAADLISQACLGAKAAHDLGIVHRDLNPRNIHVCRRADNTDWVKLLDFGIAKLDDSAFEETATGAMLGTPAYVAPEQARGEKGIDHRVDIYALGCVLFELLTGTRPHPGDSRNAILHHVCTQPALSLADLRPDLPLELASIVQRALSSNPAERPSTGTEFANALMPFVERKVWPRDSRTIVPALSRTGKGTPTTKRNASPWRWVVGIGVVVVAGSAGLYAHRTTPKPRPSSLPADLRLFVPEPNPHAVQQIADLARSNASSSVAAITTLQATPRAVWLTQTSPDEVRAQTAKAVTIARRDQSVPTLVLYNRPYRDCAGPSAGGARSSQDYHAWVEAIAMGIGNERAIVILEPDGVGIIPFNTGIDGKEEWCKPVVADSAGRMVPGPEASPADVYRQLRDAAATLRKLSPHAWVYMDATHSHWLSVGEIAYRLQKAEVASMQGFALNVSNFQHTWQSAYYGRWIAACTLYAAEKGESAYRECPRQPGHREPESVWKTMDAWYLERAPNVERDGLHFVVDTSRNGRGPLDVGVYAKPPYNQPDSVIEKLTITDWCNPPGAGTGELPTVNTGIPLVDAYLWVKIPGESDGTCDIASGTRAWDFERYNPWGIVGDSRNRFDPLWGVVAPAAGVWFPEQALDLAAHRLR